MFFVYFTSLKLLFVFDFLLLLGGGFYFVFGFSTASFILSTPVELVPKFTETDRGARRKKRSKTTGAVCKNDGVMKGAETRKARVGIPKVTMGAIPLEEGGRREGEEGGEGGGMGRRGARHQRVAARAARPPGRCH